MRAAKIVAPREWAVEELPSPEPGEGECRVAVEACGICGSDLHFLDHGLFAPGLVPGHEMAGIIDVVGPGCNGLREGQPFPMLLKECTLAFSNCYCHGGAERADFEVAAGLIDTERELLGRLVTHRLPLAEVSRSFELAADKRSGAVKVAIQPAP